MDGMSKEQDVYKRQLGRNATNTFTSRQESRQKVVVVQFVMMWCMNGLRTIITRTIRPVSYTHLDVYKRQQ